MSISGGESRQEKTLFNCVMEQDVPWVLCHCNPPPSYPKVFFCPHLTWRMQSKSPGGRAGKADSRSAQTTASWDNESRWSDARFLSENNPLSHNDGSYLCGGFILLCVFLALSLWKGWVVVEDWWGNNNAQVVTFWKENRRGHLRYWLRERRLK